MFVSNEDEATSSPKQCQCCECSCRGASEKQRRRSVGKKKKMLQKQKLLSGKQNFHQMEKIFKNTPHPHPSFDYSSDECVWLLQNMPLALHLIIEI